MSFKVFFQLYFLGKKKQKQQQKKKGKKKKTPPLLIELASHLWGPPVFLFRRVYSSAVPRRDSMAYSVDMSQVHVF